MDSARILAIDDEYILRKSIVAYLEDSGFTMYEAENGQEGLELFRKEKPDLILTDLQMPVMSGLELLEKVTKESPDTPIIVVSGAGGMNDVIEALRLGAWNYLTKPITDLEVLEHAINKALERGRLIEENKLFAEKLAKNLQILEEDQEAGRSVQMRLLPEGGKQFSEYNVNHSVIPSLYLSGDFVDYFQITDTKIGVYLADVSGHGASSAFITVLLKSLIGQIVSRYQIQKDETIITPDKVLTEISEEIYSAKLGKYMTMVYGIIDLETNKYHYSIGGHYPNPILLDPKGESRYLEGDGFPVGIKASTTYKNYEVEIPQDGHLIMLSDGIMEVFMQKESMEVQDKNLLKMVKEVNADIPSILKNVGIVDVEHEQPDDVTMLVISRSNNNVQQAD